MFQRLVTVAARQRQLTRSVLSGVRAFSVSAARNGGDGHHFKQPEIYTGEGVRAGEVPSDLDQATGLERLELLNKMKGQELWDMHSLKMTRLGTLEDPLVVETEHESRFVGCTGYPAESHDVLWLTVTHEHKVDRCPECGCVYQHKFRQMPQ